jgi:hypothetical protein
MVTQTKRPTDVSIDLETLGHRGDAAVVAIGAAAFNRHTGVIGPTYYCVVDLEDALKHGRVTAGTLRFWLGNGIDPKAKVIFAKSEPEVTLYEALRGLNDFVRNLPANVCVWGNGSSFDISILEHAYDSIGKAGFVEQWQFWSVRDMRTALDMSGIDKPKIKFDGVPHNARDDAIHQAKIIVACFGAQPSSTEEQDDEL